MSIPSVSSSGDSSMAATRRGFLGFFIFGLGYIGGLPTLGLSYAANVGQGSLY